MSRSFGAMARTVARFNTPAVLRYTVFAGAAALVMLAASALGFGRSAALAAVTCDRNATPSTFASEVSAASAGQTICLASGSYGTWQGTSKAITIKAADGASPSMRVDFGSGDAGFTLDGMGGMGGNIASGARDITIKNSAFTSEVDVNGTPAGSNIVFDRNSHNNISGNATSQRFLVAGAVTIRNSHFEGGGSDGVRLASSLPALVENNVFLNILDDGSGNHTDNIQVYGGSNSTIRGNLFKQTVSGETQVIGAYDGTASNLIEDNVIDVTGRNWGIELYDDRGSIVRHNTVVYHSSCTYNQPCGYIALSSKSGGTVGTGTQVYDNVGTVTIDGGSTAARNDHNQNGSAVAYTGPMTSYSGFTLSSGSMGKAAASDGLDLGARIGAAGATPTTPTDIAAQAVWTAPTNAVVGTAVTLDGSASRGDGPLVCTWSIEDQAGTTVYETVTGCKLSRTFQSTGTKYAKLTVRDADGDTNSAKKSFNVAAAAPLADIAAQAIWTAPTGARVGQAVTLDGTGSKGDGPLTCTWSFEDQAGTTVFETLTGCKLSKAFRYAGTKYVKLTVRDADGDTNSNKKSFSVS